MNRIPLLLMCLICLATTGQNQLSGIVRNRDGGALPDMLVQLLRSNDSSLVKSEFTGAAGNYLFSSIPSGTYLVQVQEIGAKPQLEGPVAVEGSVERNITITGNAVAVQEVQVTARKPYIERSRGKVVLNIESSINAEGSSVYDILEKAPGIRIDNNDNISLNGKPGTVVYIDGKPSPMTGADLANFLRGINSGNIEKIELIANPSSRYDAAGSSIINVRFKKDRKVGTNGSANVFYGQGVYPKAGGGLSLNHRDKKFNAFGSYNYAHRRVFSNLLLERQFSERDSFTGAYVQDNLLKFDFNNHVARGGVDYYLNKRNTIGILVSGVDNRFNPAGENISEVRDHNNRMSSYFTTSNRSKDHWHNYATNLNYSHVLDTAGSELSVDLDYAKYGNETSQNFTTRYYDLTFNENARPYLLHGDLAGQLDIYSLKTDLTKMARGGHRVEAGQKSSYVVADNRLSFFDRSFGTDIFDSSKSNHFIYTENINAAYVNWSRDLRKFSFQLGLRIEHTNVTGEQRVYNTSFSRNYAQLFPSGVITYKRSDDHNVEFSFSRRIRRPSYEQLNPFKFYLDPTTYKEGNPYLKPEITENFELSHVFRQKITTALSFATTRDNIIETIAPLQDNSRITVQTNRNLARVNVFSFNVTVPVEIRKWWYTSTSVNVYYAAYTGNIANTPITNRGNVVCNVNTSNTFNFGPKWSAEVGGNFNSPEIYAYDKIRPIWFMNAGIQRKMWNNRGTLRLNVNDIFYSNRIRARVDYTGYTEFFHVRRDTRVVTLSFTWKFGKATVPQAKRRQGGAEDIKQRAGKNAG